MYQAFSTLTIALLTAGCATVTNAEYWVVEGAQGKAAVHLATQPEGGELSRDVDRWLQPLGLEARNADAPDEFVGSVCRDPARVPDGWRIGQTITLVDANGPASRRITGCGGDLYGHMIDVEFTVQPTPTLPALATTATLPAEARVVAPTWRPAPAALKARVFERLEAKVPGTGQWSASAKVDHLDANMGGADGLVHAVARGPGCEAGDDGCGIMALFAKRPRGVLEIVSLAGIGPNDREVGPFARVQVAALLRERHDGPWRMIGEFSNVGWLRTELLRIESGKWVSTLLVGFIGG